MKSSNVTKVLVTIVLIALVSLSLWWFLGKKNSEKVTCEMVEVERVTMSSSITATGTVEPVSQVEVGTQVSGIVSRLYVDYNSEVKKGQVIAELDKTNLMSDLESKKATFGSEI